MFSETRALVREQLGRRPFVVRGLADDWPALTEWTFERLRQRVGRRAVTVYRVEDGDLVFDSAVGLSESRLVLETVLDRITSGAPATHRVRSVLGRELPDLLRDIRIPAACSRRARRELNLWISGAHVRSRVHFDQPENLLVQLRGHKDVWLFPPGDRRHLDPYPLSSPNAQFSRIDLKDATDAPAHTRPVRVCIEPGDAVFIPGGWWHYLESDEPTISLGIRWWRMANIPKLLLAELYKRARGHTR